MIDNDLKKSIRDMGVFEFLIRQSVRKDIQYFFYKIKKSQILS